MMRSERVAGLEVDVVQGAAGKADGQAEDVDEGNGAELDPLKDVEGDLTWYLIHLLEIEIDKDEQAHVVCVTVKMNLSLDSRERPSGAQLSSV